MTRFGFLTLSMSFLLLSSLNVSAETADPGQKVYENACAACHASGLAGAPKLGDQSAWQKRLEKGTETLVDHAVNGYRGDAGFMPAKGGNPSLSNTEVEAAVKYMIDQSK